MFRQGFEASQRALRVADDAIAPLVEKAVDVYVGMLSEENDLQNMGWEQLERLA
jgi:hypothetical protein